MKQLEVVKKNTIPHTQTSGFTLLELMIILAIIGLLASITIPNMIRARSTAQISDCINNLRQVDTAVQEWAIEANAGIGLPVTSDDIRPFLGRGASGSIQTVYCPADVTKLFDNSYEIPDSSSKPNCRIVPGSTPGVSHFIN